MKRVLILYIAALVLLYASCTTTSKNEPSAHPHIILLTDLNHASSCMPSTEGVNRSRLDSLSATSINIDRMYLSATNPDENDRSVLTGRFPWKYSTLMDSIMKEERKAILFKSETARANWTTMYPRNGVRHVSTLPKVLSESGYQSLYMGPGTSFDPGPAGFYKSVNTSDLASMEKILTDHLAIALSTFSWIAIANEKNGTFDCNQFINTLLNWPAVKSRNPIILYWKNSGQGENLHETISSPLIIHLPDYPPQQLNDVLTQEVDIFATLIDLAGAVNAEKTDAASLFKIISSDKIRHRQYVAGVAEKRWLRTSDYLFVDGKSKISQQLYDVIGDPECSDNMIDYHPAKAERFKAVLSEMLRSTDQ